MCTRVHNNAHIRLPRPAHAAPGLRPTALRPVHGALVPGLPAHRRGAKTVLGERQPARSGGACTDACTHTCAPRVARQLWQPADAQVGAASAWKSAGHPFRQPGLKVTGCVPSCCCTMCACSVRCHRLHADHAATMHTHTHLLQHPHTHAAGRARRRGGAAGAGAGTCCNTGAGRGTRHPVPGPACRVGGTGALDQRPDDHVRVATWRLLCGGECTHSFSLGLHS